MLHGQRRSNAKDLFLAGSEQFKGGTLKFFCLKMMISK